MRHRSALRCMMHVLVCAAMLPRGTVGAQRSSPAEGGRATAQVRAGDFTLAQVMSAPFPTGLVSGPGGRGIAWVFDDRGARNVWVAFPPEYTARQVTHFEGDDGWDIGAVRWMPDMSGLVFVRGTEPNSKGEYPNPALDPRGAGRYVMRVNVDGSGLRTIGDGASPTISPDGRSVAFTRDGDRDGEVWLVSLTDSVAAPARLFVGRGHDGELRWAPDGSALAFTSTRGDHAFVGVYRLEPKSITYLDPSVDTDEHPVWSPDSRHVAFVREPALTRQNVHALRIAGLPWSIRVADAVTGKGSEVWHASSGAGSLFHETAATDQLIWSNPARIVFPWERGGWTHLYSLAVNGGAPTELTPGAFEVAGYVLATDGRSVVYGSNAGDIDRQHLWSVSVDGGAPRRLTNGVGIEWSPVALAGGAVGMLRSDARQPPLPAVLLGDSSILVAQSRIPGDFPLSRMVVPDQVTFPSADGLIIHGQLFRPRDAGAARHPAVIFFHGGSRRQMLLGWNRMSYYSNAYALNQYLASRGYTVLSVNYRGGIGYGLDFREAVGQGPLGGTEDRDISAAVRFLKGRADVDSARIGVWGGSYGGYMTAMSLARHPADFVVGVDFAGVHDWNLEWARLVDTWDESREMAARRVALASSPMFDLSRWRAPVLLIQGDDDPDVAFAQTVQLTEDLRSRGVHVETLIFPDETHDFLRHRDWVRSYDAAAAFLERYLSGMPPQ